MSATGSVRYLGKKPSSAEVKERYYNVGVDIPATSSPIADLSLSDNYGTSYVEVTLNGVKLDQQDYTATDGSTISFATGIDLVSGDVLGVKSYDFASTPRVNPIIQQRNTIGTTTDSQQQVFDVAFTSTLDEVLVYLNGSLLDTTEYTADTSSNQVTLTNPPTNGDKLTILVYGATKVIGSAEAVTQTYIDNQIAGQATTINNTISTKADQTYVDGETSRIDGDIAVLQSNKADVTYVDQQIATKATLTQVDTAIQNVSLTTDQQTYDILSPQTTTTSISSTHFDNDNVVWFAKDGSLVTKSGEIDGSSGARNDGELNNFVRVTKTAGILNFECSFALMDLNEIKDGTGFNTSDINTARSALDPSERWTSTIEASSGTVGLNCSIADSHDLLPFHVVSASGGTGDGSLGIVPHTPCLGDQDIIYITGIGFGGALPPTFDPNNLTTNRYLDIYDWRSSPMKAQLHYHSGADNQKIYKLSYISGTNGLALSELTADPNSLYHIRYYKDGWSDPSGYYKNAIDNGSGPASISLMQQGPRIDSPAVLDGYKICTLAESQRPTNEIEVSVDSIVTKSNYQAGLTSTLTTLEGLGYNWKINTSDSNLFNPHTLGSSINDAVTNGTWFGPWGSKKTNSKLLSDLCYGYVDNDNASPYRRGLINNDLIGQGSHHAGIENNWEYKTSAMGGLYGTAFQSSHFIEANDSYKYFVPNSHFTNKPYGFDTKWYAFSPSSTDKIVGTKLTIKTNGDVFISGKSISDSFNLGHGPLFYNSKRTAFFGVSFSKTITL